ncbi:MAG TPA: SRPBCC family protein [Jiangellaceae bacterium]
MAWRTATGALVLLGAAGSYVGLVTGAVPADLGIGRRMRRLSLDGVDIRAPRELVFDVIAEPYLSRQTRVVAEKITILERGADMVLAAHRTPVHGGRLIATTVETVHFARPHTVSFRLVRGPVPHVTERFILVESGEVTRLNYDGELGTDLWALGSWWGRVVANTWERTVAKSLAVVKTEAERRYRGSRQPTAS